MKRNLILDRPYSDFNFKDLVNTLELIQKEHGNLCGITSIKSIDDGEKTKIVYIKPFPDIVIETKQLDHVINHNGILYNTNNHYIDEKIKQPDNYKFILSQGHTKNWVDKFHDNYHKITIPKDEIKWMWEASKIGMITGKFSHIYDDELNAMCEQYEHLFPKGKWFIRSDRVSLKEGMYGVGPYTSFKSMIESSVSSGDGHNVFEPDDIEINFYLFPWLDINEDKEFRIFVYNNEITAISSQHLYQVNNWLSKLSDDKIKEAVYKILLYFDEHIKDKMTYMGSYTMDLALVEPNNDLYFIEPNSFGKYYAAGSALYSWIYDHDILYDDKVVTVRYCNEY